MIQNDYDIPNPLEWSSVDFSFLYNTINRDLLAGWFYDLLSAEKSWPILYSKL